MSTLDQTLISKAKKEFFSKYGTEIHNLGYNLVAGIMSFGDSLAIMATIQDSHGKGTEHEVLEAVEKIIPESYIYQETKIPVVTRYVGKVVKL